MWEKGSSARENPAEVGQSGSDGKRVFLGIHIDDSD